MFFYLTNCQVWLQLNPTKFRVRISELQNVALPERNSLVVVVQVHKHATNIGYVYVRSHIDIILSTLTINTVCWFYVVSIVLLFNLRLWRDSRHPLSLANPHTDLILFAVKWQRQCSCEIDLQVVVPRFQELFGLSNHLLVNLFN